MSANPVLPDLSLDEVIANVTAERAACSAEDVQRKFDALPDEINAAQLDSALGPFLDDLAPTSRLTQEAYLKELKKKYGVPLGTLREALKARSCVELLRGEVVAADGGYRDVASKDMISTFLIKVERRVQLDGGQVMLEAQLENARRSSSQRVVLPPSAFQSKRAFFHHVHGADFQWMGTDENLQAVAKDLSEFPVPAVHGTKTLGYVQHEAGARWVAPETVITSDGVNVVNDMVCVEAHSSLAGRLKYPTNSDDRVRALAAAALPKLVGINAPSVILPIVAWFMASLFKVQLHRLMGHFSILFTVGTKGSGKTSQVLQVWRMLGVTGGAPYSVASTKFSLVKLISATTSVPVFLDEYKPGDMPPGQVAMVHRLLRQAYGGESEERGRADQGVNTYTLSAPLVVAGEAEVSDDPALRERLIVVRPNKQELESHPEWQRNFAELTNLELEGLAAPLIVFSLQQDVETDLAAARSWISSSGLAGVADLPLRQKDSIVIVVFGLQMFERFATSVGVNLSLDIAAVARAFLADALDGDRGVKDAFDDFLADLATYAGAGHLLDGTHYAVVGGHPCIHLRRCYDEYVLQRARTGRKDGVNGLPALQRIIDEKIKRGSYIVRKDHRVDLAGALVRTIEIDPTRIPANLDVDQFPRNNDRRHGGIRAPGRSILPGPDTGEPDLSPVQAAKVATA